MPEALRPSPGDRSETTAFPGRKGSDHDDDAGRNEVVFNGPYVD
jgi:hypothetical protein